MFLDFTRIINKACLSFQHTHILIALDLISEVYKNKNTMCKKTPRPRVSYKDHSEGFMIWQSKSKMDGQTDTQNNGKATTLPLQQIIGCGAPILQP